MLREAVEDFVPWSLRSNEHVRCRFVRRLVDQRPIRHTDLAFVALQYSSEKHFSQRLAWWPSASPINTNESAPLVTLSFSGSISPQGKNAEPVIARHREQWQINAVTNSSETS